jgi:hypothetical protein
MRQIDPIPGSGVNRLWNTLLTTARGFVIGYSLSAICTVASCSAPIFEHNRGLHSEGL